MKRPRSESSDHYVEEHVRGASQRTDVNPTNQLNLPPPSVQKPAPINHLPPTPVFSNLSITEVRRHHAVYHLWSAYTHARMQKLNPPPSFPSLHEFQSISSRERQMYTQVAENLLGQYNAFLGTIRNTVTYTNNSNNNING